MRSLATLAVLLPALAVGAPPPELRASADDRRLVPGGGEPSVWIGETAWEGPVVFGPDNAAGYGAFPAFDPPSAGPGSDWGPVMDAVNAAYPPPGTWGRP